MIGFPYVDVDYCKSGMPYIKSTRLWNNVNGFKQRPLCKKDSNTMVGNKHMCSAQQAKATSDRTGPQQRFKQSEVYGIPTELIHDMFSYMV